MVRNLIANRIVLLLFCAIALLTGCETLETKPALVQEREAEMLLGFKGDEQKKVTLRSGVVFSMLVEVDGINEIEVEELRVRQDGSAVLPMVGAVDLDGLTLSEASEQLSMRYSMFYKETPLIRMQFVLNASGDSSPWGYVTVLGRVKKPGRVNLPSTRDLTVSGAIQGADGFATSANLKAVRISRTDAQNGSRQIIVDMDMIGKGEAIKDVHLKAGDLIYVPETIF